jgi:predicted NUDIX family NTP pyrophosphohydrolase
MVSFAGSQDVVSLVKPPATSAGILVYWEAPTGPEFLLAHPGGPFWKNRDAGVWTVPKGLLEAGESPLEAAAREFQEETGLELPGEFYPPLSP